MDKVKIRRMDGVAISDIHKCWHEAFADYKLPFQLPLDRLSIRLRQVNYDPTFSYGAFEGGRLIGFWLSGYRRIDGVPTGYDAGTAIVPEWRHSGLSKRLFERVEEDLRDARVKKYILEVFCDNHSAISLYEKNGFRQSRLLHCYKADAIKAYRAYGNVRYTTRTILLKELERIYPSLLDYEPSWQNTWDAMISAADSTVAAVVEKDEEVVGYGIIQPVSRRISQMGIIKCDVQEAFAGMLLDELYKAVGGDGELEVVHVPEGDTVIHSLLCKLGFRHLVSLYEMTKTY